MDNPIAQWHAEHGYFGRLLNLLEGQVDVFHAGEQPNYELMLDIIDYLRLFSDQSHHPREDVAFACLARRSPELQLPLARLVQEHRVIANVGDRLRQSLEQALAGGFVERADIEAVAATYLVYYRSHFAREDNEVLPQAARILTAEDWQAVSAATHVAGALSQQASDQRFQALRRRIALES